jgi:DNA-binding NarL/FixJ family response regulator
MSYARREPSDPHRPESSRAPRLLIVDDHAPMRGLIRALASRLGYEIAGEAADGQQGVSAALELEPDVIVMDWHMPELDGVAATREIHHRRPTIEIVAYSSAEEEAIADAFREAGARAYISKTDVDGLVSELKRRITPRESPRPPALATRRCAAD